jgi:uncharacterized protein
VHTNPRPTRVWWENLLRGIRHLYKRILRTKSSPHDIALGMALGMFVGLLPIIPFQTVLVLAVAVALRCSKLAALMGTLVTNPLTIPFLYLFMFRLGRFLLPDTRGRFNPEHLTIHDLLQKGTHFYGSMFLGGVLIGLPCAVLTYVLTLKAIRAHQHRRERKMSASPYKKKSAPTPFSASKHQGGAK